MKIHETYIKRCIQLAKNGLPAAMPNPSVGALLVHHDTIIAEGYTSAYGGAHAEVNCIAFAKANTPHLISDSTLYVTLEPCSHFGKTPPCADLVIDSGIPRVVIGTIDPFAKVAGRGLKKLIEANVDVTVGILEEECKAVNKRFFTFHEKKRPYVILKWAQSLDGYIAPLEKEQQKPVWLTNQYSRQLVHKWRGEEQAILIGANTAISDNPSLTTRDWHGVSPIRIVIDTTNSLSRDLAIFDDQARTIVLNTINVSEICTQLYNEGIQSIIIEGGTKTLQRFIESTIWDEARVFTGTATIVDGVTAPKLSKNFKEATSQMIKNDILTMYKNNQS